MSSVLIVGSGATGVHFAATALERGHDVVMLDVGHERPAAVLPEADFDGLKEQLDDPVSYFLGPRGETVVYPSRQAKFYGFPPSKSYVFANPERFAAQSNGFEPVTSFAAGGLAEAWTGGVYALNDAELTDFPCNYRQLEPHYREVARRIGISAADDDLARFAPFSPEYQPPLETDEHSALLLRRYQAVRARMHRRLGFYLGRSRVAVLSRDQDDRKACDYLGRCLWGCPRESLYAPSATLRRLKSHPRFRYQPGLYVDHFTQAEGRVTGMVASPTAGGERLTFTADHYVLAAGTLCSSRIFLDSQYRSNGQVAELRGLMDNRQMMIPFITLRMMGRPVATHSYQFHQVALGITGERPEEYVHGQITALKAAAIHPIVQSMPVDMRSALGIFRSTHAALGVANVWLHDRRRPENLLTIQPDAEGRTRLLIRYAPDDGDGARVRGALRTMRRALWKLGAIIPPGMTKVLPQGASIHYAGTIPMSREPRSLTASTECRSHDFSNLILADGATFPFLPAKNLTYTLMANAVRVASTL